MRILAARVAASTPPTSDLKAARDLLGMVARLASDASDQAADADARAKVALAQAKILSAEVSTLRAALHVHKEAIEKLQAYIRSAPFPVGAQTVNRKSGGEV